MGNPCIHPTKSIPIFRYLSAYEPSPSITKKHEQMQLCWETLWSTSDLLLIVSDNFNYHKYDSKCSIRHNWATVCLLWMQTFVDFLHCYAMFDHRYIIISLSALVVVEEMMMSSSISSGTFHKHSAQSVCIQQQHLL